uniref:7TM_GPCR_Srx domain-containing protein n=1 Tax=Meloidogyne hapla TaxID=6305 RepID=A0A1I8BPJ9_MELHA
MSLNISSINSTIEFTSIKSAYEFYKAKCDIEKPSSVGTASAFMFAYSIAAPLQIFILPTNFRLAKQFSAFQLLMYINLFNIVWFVQYIWLCIETVVDSRITIPYNWDAYPFRFVNFCIDFLYMHLALNRSMAVLDTRGNLFNIIFDKSKNKIYISVTLILGVLYSIHSNWYQQRRPFHCLNVVDYFEPSTGIPSVCEFNLNQEILP